MSPRTATDDIVRSMIHVYDAHGFCSTAQRSRIAAKEYYEVRWVREAPQVGIFTAHRSSEIVSVIGRAIEMLPLAEALAKPPAIPKRPRPSRRHGGARCLTAGRDVSPEMMSSRRSAMRRSSHGPLAALSSTFVSDLYRFEIRRLRARLLKQEFPKREYADRVVQLRMRYRVISLRPREWIE